MTTLTLAPLAAAHDFPQIPAWFAPSHRQDPLFPVLAGLRISEIQVAILASDAPFRALDPQRLTTDQAVGFALAGLRRIGVDEARYLAEGWRQINRRYLALPDDRSHAAAWDREVACLRGGWLRAGRRRDAALSVAAYIDGGIYHDSAPSVLRDGLCLSRGTCRQCYPHTFAPEVAR